MLKQLQDLSDQLVARGEDPSKILVVWQPNDVEVQFVDRFTLDLIDLDSCEQLDGRDEEEAIDQGRRTAYAIQLYSTNRDC